MDSQRGDRVEHSPRFLPDLDSIHLCPHREEGVRDRERLHVSEGLACLFMSGKMGHSEKPAPTSDGVFVTSGEEFRGEK